MRGSQYPQKTRDKTLEKMQIIHHHDCKEIQPEAAEI